MASYRNFSIFVIVFIYHASSGIQSLFLEKRDPTLAANSGQLNPIRALIYRSYKKTTIEEKKEPIIQYAIQMGGQSSQEDIPRNDNQFIERSPRKKRSLGYGIGILNPISSISSLSYGTGTYGGYGGYGAPLGYGYNRPYGYGNNYGSYYGYGSGYGNYGYGYGTGYGGGGGGYYDPYCD